jgi:enterochelin esterase-like enzyme
VTSIPRRRIIAFVALAVAGILVATGLFLSSDLSRHPAAEASTPAAPAPMSAARTESRSFFSPAIERTMPYVIFLPPGYDSTGQHYPVLYMLHGLGGSCREWQGYGFLETAQRMMEAGEIQPFIIVLAEGERAYWVNHANGGPSWGTYIARDLLAAVDQGFRTVPDRSARAIGGDSMGGHGALQLAINNPSVFGVVGAHSFALRRYETAFGFFGDRASFNQRDPVYLYHASPEVARTLTLWLDIGDQDTWQPAAAAFHAQLTRDAIPHLWHQYPGGHTGDYWTAHTPDYLRFYSGALDSGAVVTVSGSVLVATGGMAAR